MSVPRLLSLAASTLFFATFASAGPLVDLAAAAEKQMEAGRPDQALNSLAEATRLVWDASPLFVNRVLFVDEASAFGLYVPRADGSVFKQDEALLMYIEPVGFGYGQNGAGSYSIGFDIDFALSDAEETVLSQLDDFGQVETTLRYKNREFFLNLTVNLSGVPAGSYIANIRLRDKHSDKIGGFQLPFTVTE